MDSVVSEQADRRRGVTPETEPRPSPPATRTAPAAGLAPPAKRPVGDLRLQLALSIVLVIASWITVRPLGVLGVDGLATVLLVANSVFVVARNLGPTTLSPAAGLVLMCSWAVLAAALLSVRSLTLAPAFAYFVAGHAGYRLPARLAVAVAGGLGVLSALGLRIAQTRGLPGWPWLLGLTVALPVFIGMANRSRDLAVASALAAANAARRAAESEAQARALTERARISRDVHDVLAHSLSGVSMQLELSEMLLDQHEIDRARQAIERAHSMVREGMAEAKRAVTALRAEVLPLPQTLQALFAQVSEVTVIGPERELSTEITQTFLRSAQEALTNARRHAAGGALRVSLEYRAADVEVEVVNGPGAEAGRSDGSGMGLVGMRERAALLNGTVEVGPIIDGPWGGGWRVAVTLPG